LAAREGANTGIIPNLQGIAIKPKAFPAFS